MQTTNKYPTALAGWIEGHPSSLKRAVSPDPQIDWERRSRHRAGRYRDRKRHPR